MSEEREHAWYMSGGGCSKQRESKCKGPEVREGLKCDHCNDHCSWRGVSKGARVGDESRESVGEIVPGLVACGEDFTFTLSELGATGRLRAEGQELI